MRTISSPITFSYSFFSSWSFGSSLYRCEMDENAAIVSACSSQPSSRANSRNDATRQVEKGGATQLRIDGQLGDENAARVDGVVGRVCESGAQHKATQRV